MKRFSFLLILASIPAYAHDVITTNITFNREIVRIFHARCIACHHPGGTAFPLLTYQQARPWAKAIEEEVLQRRMPPWGAVKGFGNFRNDQALTMEQLELIVNWVEGGGPEGDAKDIPPPNLATAPALTHPANELVVSGDTKLPSKLLLDGLWPKNVGEEESIQIRAELPDGSIIPLLWLRNYKKQYDHPFRLRTPLALPRGTLIRGVPRGASVALLPVMSTSVGRGSKQGQPPRLHQQ